MRPETKFEPERAPGSGRKRQGFGEGSYSSGSDSKSALDGASQSTNMFLGYWNKILNLKAKYFFSTFDTLLEGFSLSQ